MKNSAKYFLLAEPCYNHQQNTDRKINTQKNESPFI